VAIALQIDRRCAPVFARNPEALANKVYGGRMGNDLPGDGWKFRGRGLKQLTGKSNYVAYMLDSGLDCVTYPDLILLLEHAADSAAWFWKTNGCNRLADAGDVRALTLKINGGLTGFAARLDATRRALAALNA
jgi:putative chitinase